jgi:hypothetical protein
MVRRLPPAEAAAKTRRSLKSIHERRYILGVTGTLSNHWLAKEIALLGTMSDEQLAKKLRRTAIGVRNMRYRYGIPAHRAKPPRHR